VDPAFQHRLELAQPFQRGFAQALVAADHVPLAGGLLLLVKDRCLDRRDLPVEAALVPGALGVLLRGQAERVDVLAGDAPSLGDPLGGGELIGQIDVPRRGPQDAAVGTRIGAEADPAHRLDPARDADVDSTRRDQAGDEAVGLLAAAALAIHGHGANLLRQPGDEPAHPGDVVGLLAVLGHAATDDLFDIAGVDTGLVHDGLLHRAQQLGGVQS
jgi:hypothetical protein